MNKEYNIKLPILHQNFDENSTQNDVYSSVSYFEEKFQNLIQEEKRQEKSNQYKDVAGGVLFLRYYNIYREKLEKEKKQSINPQRIKKELSTKFKKQVKIPLLRYEDIKNIYPLLLDIDMSYNTEDGQIRWLEHHGYDNINLDSFWTVIPNEIKQKMTLWRHVNSPLIKAKELQAKLKQEQESLLTSYNTEDGQIRWLEDHGYTNMNLGHFWSIIPNEIKEKMTFWEYINFSLIKAKELQATLRQDPEILLTQYNTEDGQIRWLEDHGYTNMNLDQFWSVIPNEIKEIMSEWQYTRLTLIKIKKLQAILRQEQKTLKSQYNTEDGQIRWLEDHNYTNMNLSHFWSVIPNEIKEIMSKWKNMRLPFIKAKKIRNDLLKNKEELSEKFNTESGEVQWLEDHGYTNMNLCHFWSVIPNEIRKIMTEWKKIQLPLIKAKNIRNDLLNIDDLSEKYNTEEGQIRWLEDHGYHNINLGHFWSVIPNEIKEIMSEWKYISLPFIKAKEVLYTRKWLREFIQTTYTEIYEYTPPIVFNIIIKYLTQLEETNKENIKNILANAIEKQDTFISELGMSSLNVKGYDLELKNMKDLYLFAEEKLNLSPAETYIILKIKGLNISGLKTISKNGYRRIEYLSIDTPISQYSDVTFGDRVSQDNNEKSIQEVLIYYYDENKFAFPLEIKELYKNLIENGILEDEGAILLAKELKKHPELIELLEDYL